MADLEDARLYAYRRSDGERQPGRDMDTAPAPMGLWSDGETLWAAGLGGGLRAHRQVDGTRQAWRDLELEANAAPAGVWLDAETAWVADWLGDTVHAYRLADGKRLAARDIKLDGGNLLPVGLWSDGETLWVGDWRERLYAYRLSDGGRDPRRDIETGAEDTDPTGLWAGGETLLTTGWQDGRVRAYRLPAAVAGAPGKKPVNGPVARAASLPVIADPALRDAIGAALGKSPGEAASPQELAGLESLTARNAGIRDLSGLEQALSPKELDLGFNPLEDLRPLGLLPALESLSLDGSALDLGSLASLTGLSRLSIRHNLLDDLQPLALLAGLTELDVGDNRIEDLGALGALTQLLVLRADRSRIEDVWPGRAGGAGPGDEPDPGLAAPGGDGTAQGAANRGERPVGVARAIRAEGTGRSRSRWQQRQEPGLDRGPGQLAPPRLARRFSGGPAIAERALLLGLGPCRR